MKILCFCTLIFCGFVSALAAPWGNGGTSKSLSKVKFGTHDCIAYEGLLIAKEDVDLDWLENNLNAFFFGTEAADLGVRGIIANTGGGYKDTGACHCILFNSNGDVVNDRVARRVQEEFGKAKAILDKPNPTASDYRLAAFYLGAMSHYLGDLSQFIHLFGEGSHWGNEDHKVHSRYEKVIDKSVLFTTKKSTILSSYIRKRTIAGTTPRAVALSLAKFTETGGGTVATPGWMYDRYLTYIDNGIARDTDQWDTEFLDQTGNNVNMAVNAVAKLLKQVVE